MRLRGHNWVLFSPIGHSVLLPWIQTLLSLKPEIVFKWNKRICVPIILWKKKKKKIRVFVVFKIIFLRNRSFSNARCIYGKKCKIGKGNLYLTENRFSRGEMWCAVVNHNHMRHMYAKGFLDWNFKFCEIFTKLPQISHTHKNWIVLLVVSR